MQQEPEKIPDTFLARMLEVVVAVAELKSELPGICKRLDNHDDEIRSTKKSVDALKKSVDAVSTKINDNSCKIDTVSKNVNDVKETVAGFTKPLTKIMYGLAFMGASLIISSLFDIQLKDVMLAMKPFFIP